MLLQITFTLQNIAIMTIVYIIVVRFLRYRCLRHFKKEYQQIDGHWNDLTAGAVIDNLMMYSGKYEFPFMMETSVSFGMLKTYAIPTISHLLAKTKKFEKTPLKRCDDTDIIIREISENNLSSLRSQTAVRRLNFIHGQYKISNDDMLYTLSVFCCEPYIWISRYKYEWRSFTKEELDVTYHYWRRLGIEMGIHSIPGSFEDMLRFHDEYEEDCMVFAESNRDVAEATTNLVLNQIPSFLKPLTRKMIICLMDERLRTAMGYEEVHPIYRTVAVSALKIRAFIIRNFCLPRVSEKRRTSKKLNENGLLTLNFHTFAPIYRDGYKIEELGSATKGVLGEVNLLQVNSVLPVLQKYQKFPYKCYFF